MKIAEILVEDRNINPELVQLGLDSDSVSKFVRYMVTGENANVHYDPYSAARGSKISHGRAKAALMKDLLDKTSDVKVAFAKLHRLYDTGGESALYEDTMKIRELITEGARIEHPEDLVFTNGSRGALEGLKSIADLAHGTKHVTVKWDGSPALIFGRDSQGRFIMTDKSGWGAKGYNGRVTSSDDLAAMMMARGGDPAMRKEFAMKLKSIWPMFAASVPPNFKGFFWGDLLWFTTPPLQNGKFVFKPNTVTYRVDANSDLGKRIAKSRAGMVIHQFFPDENSDPQPVKDISVLKQDQGVLFLTPEMEEDPEVHIDTTKIEQAMHYLQSNAEAIDRLLDPSTLAAKKLTSLPLLMKQYINQRVRQGNLKNLESGFLSWIEGKEPAKFPRIKEHIDQNELGFFATMIMFTAITHLKELVVHQLDAQQGSVQASVGDAPGGEGYVAKTPGGLVKFVNRLGFSAANFAKND